MEAVEVSKDKKEVHKRYLRYSSLILLYTFSSHWSTYTEVIKSTDDDYTAQILIDMRTSYLPQFSAHYCMAKQEMVLRMCSIMISAW